LWPKIVGPISTLPRIVHRTGPLKPVSPGGGVRLSVAARLTPSPPREWPISSTFDRSAAGAAFTASGAEPRAEDHSAHFAKWWRTKEERPCAPASTVGASCALMPLAEMDTVT
jgi:hypothetical protein